LASIPENVIDFICADFPYNISNKPGLTKRGGEVVAADFGEWDKFESPAIYFDFVFRVIDEYKRIVKPKASMVLFFSYKYAGWI
jgi:DNA modification methylase